MDTTIKCKKCEYQLAPSVRQCPICGTRVQTAGQIRGLGVVQLLLGLILVGMMGTITVLLAPTMLSGSKAGFSGTPGQAVLILLLFGAVIVFGLASCVSGLYHVIVGKRNKWIAIGAVILGFILMGFAMLVRELLGA